MGNSRLAHVFIGVYLVSLFAVSTIWAQRTATNSTDNKAGSKAAAKVDSDMAYLGVEVESLHPSLASHLPGDIMHGQGILVMDVVPDSPAEKAGLKEHDVLTSYDDQKLYAPEQLAKLVQADKPQHEVTLGIVRRGKSEQLKVKLGSEPYDQEPLPGGWEPRGFGSWDWGVPEQSFLRPQARRNSDASWESFDSMTLRKIGDHRFKVEIQYLDKSGKKEQHAFEGTREEIRRDIAAEKDLPANERNHLLSSLGLTNDEFDRSARFPMWNYGPWNRPY
jgi:hypothetical protein